MNWICLILTGFGLATLMSAGRPYVHDPDCPRKPGLVHLRECRKKCRSDADCKGKHKRCLCDDVCGKSCVKESRPCRNLNPVFHGSFEIIPYNKFGARAVYSCDDGYVLSGPRDRTCQGDQLWTGNAPTCETKEVYDTIIQKSTPNPELAGEESNTIKHQRHKDSKCRDPAEVPHAYHDGPRGQRVFPVGTQLNYNCTSGYQINGFRKAMCVGDGRWVGPRVTCSPKRCSHPGDVTHGYREGSIFMYPSTVTYRCAEGYSLHGSHVRTCQHDGQWSGFLPTCQPVKCEPLSAPANGEMIALHPEKNNSYGAEVQFSCHRGFSLNGSDIRQCKKDGEWGGRPVSCPVVDCGLPGPFYNGHIEALQTTYGATIQFKCFGRTTFAGDSPTAVCKADGTWSSPLPNCWSKCEISDIANGTLASEAHYIGKYVTHGEQIRYTCNTGHVLNTNELPTCVNGSWNFLPRCVPAPCKARPPTLNEGMVRYYTSNHGDRAKYRCNTGFKLAGHMYVTCQYGKWLGKAPECEENYCDHPGEIENGQILLVGVMGKYEYRPYVKRIGHTKQIEYHCNKGFKRIGPSGSTCVDGEWSPKPTTRCIKGKHPKLEQLEYLRRGKRAVPSSHPVTAA